MKIIDANVLLYAVNEDSPHHQLANSWLDSSLHGTETIGFAWVIMIAFLRLSTHPRLFPSPLTVQQAFDLIDFWLCQPAAVVVQPTARHVHLMHGILETTGVAANLVNDAHLAALALEHGAEIVSFDYDFQRFDGVRWSLPRVL